MRKLLHLNIAFPQRDRYRSGMIDDTLRKLETRLRSSSLDPETRSSLENLVAELKRQIHTLEDPEQAESIAAHTEAGAREALRREQDEDLLSHTLDGMRKSVRRFEASHPDLTSVVNSICHHLSTLGI